MSWKTISQISGLPKLTEDLLWDSARMNRATADATDRDDEVRGQRSRDFYREADRRLRQAGGR